jgi:hypothetical protein
LSLLFVVSLAALTRAGERLLEDAAESAESISEETLSMDAAQLGELSQLVAKLI